MIQERHCEFFYNYFPFYWPGSADQKRNVESTIILICQRIEGLQTCYIFYQCGDLWYLFIPAEKNMKDTSMFNQSLKAFLQ